MTVATDLIAAIATPPGRGGIGIVRVSGPGLEPLIKALIGTCPEPRQAQLHPFKNAQDEVIDEGIVIYFKAPHSFTGEDVLELQGHGGPVVLDRVLKRVLQLGARLARPGEFSERAFLNHKFDLTQVEAVADLIDAQSEQAARAAMRSLQGDFSEKINVLLKKLIHLRCYIEACIDFPEEEIDFLNDKQIQTQLSHCTETVKHILQQAQHGVTLKEGVTVAIVGPPNAGKSSLFNYFSRQPSAIVSDIPGTTRDIIKETVLIKDIPVHLLDTAGLRDNTDDVIEKMGIARAKSVINKADLVLLMMDVTDYQQGRFPALLDDFKKTNQPVILLINKIDLTDLPPVFDDTTTPPQLFLSLSHNLGLALLEETLINAIVPTHDMSEGNFIARRRHLNALQNALNALNKGYQQLTVQQAGELLAEELRLAQQALSTITGEFHSDDLLGEIFSSFCIGK